MTSHAVMSPGSRRVHLTELQAALDEPGRTGAVLANNTAVDEMERVRSVLKKLRKGIDKAVNRALRANKNWEPDAEMCIKAAKVAEAMDKAVRTEERIRKITRDERKGYTDEQLDAVLIHNLQRMAARLSDAQWWAFIAIKFGENVADVLVPGGRRGSEATTESKEDEDAG